MQQQKKNHIVSYHLNNLYNLYLFSSSTNLNKNSPDFNQNKVFVVHIWNIETYIHISCKHFISYITCIHMYIPLCIICEIHIINVCCSFRWQPCPTTVNTSFHGQSWISPIGEFQTQYYQVQEKENYHKITVEFVEVIACTLRLYC